MLARGQILVRRYSDSQNKRGRDITMNFEYRDLIYEYAMYLIDEGCADINEIDKLIEKKYHVKIDGYKFLRDEIEVALQ